MSTHKITSPLYIVPESTLELVSGILCLVGPTGHTQPISNLLRDTDLLGRKGMIEFQISVEVDDE